MEALVRETARRFRRVDRALKRLIEKRVSSTQVYRAQHQVLMHVAHHPDASQAEIAEGLGISPAALAVSLKKLEKGGYIKRSADSADERKKHMEMTDLGNEIVVKSHKMFREIEMGMFEGFSEEEIRKAAHFMDRMLENLSRNLLLYEQQNKEESK